MAAASDSAVGQCAKVAALKQSGASGRLCGLPTSAIIYITGAAPKGMQWLTLADAQKVGIDVKHLQLSSTNQNRNSTRQIPKRDRVGAAKGTDTPSSSYRDLRTYGCLKPRDSFSHLAFGKQVRRLRQLLRAV
jgi:hypothetical protein